MAKADAGDADGDDAPGPDLDIGRSLGTDAEQAERPCQRAHRADQDAREHIGVDDGKDHEPRGRLIADLGAEQRGGDAAEHDDRQQFEQKAPKHEGQPDQRLPGPRQAEPAPLQLGRRRDVGNRRRRIDDGERLHRHARGLRQPRFQERDRPLDQAEHHPFGGQRAAEHQRQLPGDIDQEAIGDRIVGGTHEPVVERREMRQRARDVGDLARHLADLLGHHQQQLCAEAVGSERDRRMLLRRRLRGGRLRRDIGDGAQRVDDLAALLVVLQRVERTFRLLGRQRVTGNGLRRRRLGGRLRKRGRDEQGEDEKQRKAKFVRHEGLIK
ncbi:hypothetical protein ACVMDO_000854 [Bradyrhizobium sp. USDA 4513]